MQASAISLNVPEMTGRSRLTVSVVIAILIVAAFPAEPVNGADNLRVLTGRLSIVYGDSPAGESFTRYFLSLDDAWNIVEVVFEEPPPESYANQIIEVRGVVLPDSNIVRVEAYSLVEMTPSYAQPQVVGTRRVINILVLYSDHQGPIPQPEQFYDSLFNAPTTSLKHYWLEVSYGKLTVVADIARNMWVTLPRGKSYYAPCGFQNVCARLSDLLQDAVSLVDPYVDFRNYDNINVIVGNDLDCCAWGGMWTLTLDGVTKTYGVTWDPPWAHNIAVFAHEMGHSFGLPHSGWVYDPYDSPWDVMSNSYVGGGDVCGTYYSMNLGNTWEIVCYIPQQTIAIYKDQLGWIDPQYKTTVNPNQAGVFTVEALSVNPPAGALKMIKINLPNAPAGHFYTVEVRRKIGYDTRLPNEGVIIHKYEQGRNRCINGWCGSGPAYPIDSTPGDGTLHNAQWSVGQTFEDPSYGLRIRVSAASGNTFTVEISWATTPSLTVLYPNGGETFQIGQLVTIQWSSENLLGNVDILLSRDGGTSWTVLYGNIANDGSEPWVVSGPPTNGAKIRVRSSSSPQVFDDSDGVFSIVFTLTVTSPNGGETWNVGTTQTISWSSQPYGTVRILLSRDGGVTWQTIVASTPNDGSHPWVVSGPPTTNALIKIVSNEVPSVQDTSDGLFTIVDTSPPTVRVLDPNGGEVLRAGRRYTIRWMASDPGGIQRVVIKYSVDGGASWLTVAELSGNSGFFRWLVPRTPTQQALIKITVHDTSGNTASDTSDRSFTIRR